jgi:UDP-glucuronate 4-epimerase
MKVLVTGAAGFIGMHCALRLLERGDEVLGLDNMSAYYDVRLKEARLGLLTPQPAFRFIKLDISNSREIKELFEKEKPQRVLHLAAQAGVRYSLVNPHAYAESNLTGFLNVLEGCRHAGVEHLAFASSSSVYGGNTKVPFAESDAVDHPVSLYAATKRANELMAHAYAHLYRLPCTGLRFFTVYGPWGRPDMALFLFTRAILEGRPIEVFNHGRMERDFTYIDDIAEGVVRALAKPAAPDANYDPLRPGAATSNAPWRLYNIGNHQPVSLLAYIETLEEALGRKAEKKFLPMQPGDVPATYADVAALSSAVGFAPSTPVQSGVRKFVEWYRAYYRA